MTKTIIITGASDGIGRETAKALHAEGHRVVLVGRSKEKTKAVADELKAPYYLSDFADLSSVRALAKDLNKNYPTIDMLYNNAGLLAPQERVETKDGHELTFQVNHLAPFLLTSLLMERLIKSKARIINTASVAHKSGDINLDNLDMEKGYKSFKAYGNSKLSNILFTRELATRYGNKGIEAVCFHPGVVKTSFASKSGGIVGFFYTGITSKFMLSSAKGADTMIWLASASDIEQGGYYYKRKVASTTKQAQDSDLATKLWDKSESFLD